MATVYDWDGWVWLTDNSATGDTYKIKCEQQPELSFEDPSAVWIEYPDSGVTGWSLKTRVRKVIFKNIWFTTTARCEQFMEFLNNHQDDTFDLKIKVHSTPTYWDWDGGDHTIMPVMWVKPRGVKKKFGGDTTIWVIGQITFRQCAALEA